MSEHTVHTTGTEPARHHPIEMRSRLATAPAAVVPLVSGRFHPVGVTSGDDGDETMNRSNYREAAVWTRFNATAGLEGEFDERARGGWDPAVFELAALLSRLRCPLSSACV